MSSPYNLSCWRVGSLLIAVALLAPAAATAHAQEGTSTQPPASTGQRISLDLKGVELVDVLKLLSERSGLNIIAGRNVSGRVTIFAKDVDVWEVFEQLIEANELAYERQGELITVMTARDYELLYGERFQERSQHLIQGFQYAKAAQVAVTLNQLKSSVGRVVADEAANMLILSDTPQRLRVMQEVATQLDRPLQTRVYQLNYADAAKLKPQVDARLSPAGSVSVDERTNTLVLLDVPEVVEHIGQLVRAFDTPEGDVLIEAKIIKVELTDETNLGIDWQAVLGGVDLTGRGNFRVLNDVLGGSATGVALRWVSASNESRLILEALQKLGKTETLSNPRIMVANHQEAKILVGTKEAFVTFTTTIPTTGSVVSSPQVEFVDVGTKLFVTPSIARDGHVLLKIRPEVSTAKVETFQNNRIPIVSTTEAETHVLVKSGTSVVIGGLIDTKEERTESRVPLLGSLPLLGAAFRGTTETTRKSELVVLLTPQIVSPDGTPLVAPPAHAPEAEASLPTVVLSDPVPAAYRQALQQRLRQQLTDRFRASGLPAGSAILSFVLAHDGQLVDEPQIASPQGEPFVQAARAALTQAQPFPPFPEGAPATTVRFRLAVDYTP